MSISNVIPDTTLPKFDLENLRSRSWFRSNLKITKWVYHPIDSHSFCSMPIGPPIPEIEHFRNLTLKIQGQGHGWGERWKSQSGCNILLTHISFVPNQAALPLLRYSIFKMWPLKSKVKVKWTRCYTTTGQDHSIEPPMVQIHPVVTEIWTLQNLIQVLPHLTSFWPHGQAHMGQMGK